MMGSKGIDAIITVLGHNETLSAIDFRPLPAQVRAKHREQRTESKDREQRTESRDQRTNREERSFIVASGTGESKE